MSNVLDKSTLAYRPCVGVMLINKHGQVFVGERTDSPGAWQMPQGGIDEGEDVVEAGLREMLEEVGSNNAEVLAVSTETLLYDLPDHLIGKLWGGKYRGQEQHWIAARFLGQDSDIDLEGHEFVEFGRWQWADIDQLPELIVPFKRDVYQRVVDMFRAHCVPIAD